MVRVSTKRGEPRGWSDTGVTLLGVGADDVGPSVACVYLRVVVKQGEVREMPTLQRRFADGMDCSLGPV